MITDDLDVFLEEWGETAICKGQNIQVIFDNDYSPMLGDFAEGRTITACAKTSEVETLLIEHLDLISIRGKNYRVDGVHPAMDGRFTDLVLSET